MDGRSPDKAVAVSGIPDILDPVPTRYILLAIPFVYSRQWRATVSVTSGGPVVDTRTKASITQHWKTFINIRVREWSTIVNRSTLLSLTWLCVLPLSATAGQIVLLGAAFGMWCALTSLFASLAYVKRQYLLERIVQEEGARRLPLNLWIFLSLPSLYFGWSLLLLGFVLLWCLCVPRHQPLSWDLAIPKIPLSILGIGLPFLVAMVPYGLVQNFQVLSRGTESALAAGKSGLQTVSSN